MPLTDKGRKIMRNMKSEYGKEKGERVFHASANKGTISGVHGKRKARCEGGPVRAARGGHVKCPNY